jgi:4'-phosphopantetheinyl transferase
MDIGCGIILGTILSEGEYDIFNKIKSFFKTWTRKEALLKAIGQGLNYPLDKIEISISSPKSPQILSTDGDKACASSWVYTLSYALKNM